MGGIVQAKLGGSSDRAGEFQAKHGAGRVAPAPGVFLWTIEDGGRLKIMIEVGEDATNDALRQAIPYALERRDKLLEFQGPWTHGGPNAQLELFHHMHTRGTSYKQLAIHANQIVTRLLHEYVEELARLDAFIKQYWYPGVTWGDLLRIAHEQTPSITPLFPFGPVSRDHAKWLLTYLRVSDEDAEKVVNEGLNRIEQGLPPFHDAEYPITREKIISALKYWRSKRHPGLDARPDDN